MDPIVIVLVVAYVSMLPYVWLYAMTCLVWRWGRPRGVAKLHPHRDQ